MRGLFPQQQSLKAPPAKMDPRCMILAKTCHHCPVLIKWSKKGGIIKDDKRNDLKSYKENDQCPEGALIVFTRKESIGTA